MLLLVNYLSRNQCVTKVEREALLLKHCQVELEPECGELFTEAGLSLLLNLVTE